MMEEGRISPGLCSESCARAGEHSPSVLAPASRTRHSEHWFASVRMPQYDLLVGLNDVARCLIDL